MASTASSAATIRAAELDDLDLVVVRRLDFLAEVRRIDRASFETKFVDATRAFLHRTHMKTSWSWFAEIDDECVGIVTVIVSDAPPRPEEFRDSDGYIVNMHVDRDQRGNGIGRLLVERALADCEARGVRRFTLHATDDGRALYESLGFSPESEWMSRYSEG